MDSQVGYQNDNSKPPPGNERSSEMQLNKTELMILRECNKESFYYRCLPFAAIGMGATFYAVKTGFLSGHPRYGPAIKMSGAAFTGWLLGKFSYRKKCEDKFLNVENSRIADAIRRKRGYVLKGSESDSSQYMSTEDYSGSLKDNYTSYSGDFHSSSGSLNFDKNEPSLELDDRERPSMDSDSSLSNNSQPARQSTSYDELRRRNREEYEKKQYHQPDVPKSDAYRRPWNPSVSEPSRRANSYSQDDSSKNTYGDTWDNPKFS